MSYSRYCTTCGFELLPDEWGECYECRVSDDVEGQYEREERYCMHCGEILDDDNPGSFCPDCLVGPVDDASICPLCSGTGEHHSGSPAPCPKCKGSGEVKIQAKEE